MGATPRSADPSERCALFDLSKVNTHTTVSEEPNAVRILLTTTEMGDVRMLRRQARDFVRTLPPEKTEKGTTKGMKKK